MKKLNIHLILIIILLLISACSSSNAETNSSNQNSEGNSNWAEENGLNKTESVDELYEKAKEEGKVIVYSRGSKFKDVKNSFEEEYPGVKIESYKMDGMELKEKLTREHGAGVYNADIVHTRLDQNLVNEGYVHPYRPEDIMENYADSYKEDEHPVQYLTINPIIYNTEVYKEPPVNNWWDLTEPEWKGKILLNDPISDATYSELFVSIIQNSDEMAEAYKEKYGKEIGGDIIEGKRTLILINLLQRCNETERKKIKAHLAKPIKDRSPVTARYILNLMHRYDSIT